MAAGSSPYASYACVDTWLTDFRADLPKIDVPIPNAVQKLFSRIPLTQRIARAVSSSILEMIMVSAVLHYKQVAFPVLDFGLLRIADDIDKADTVLEADFVEHLP